MRWSGSRAMEDFVTFVDKRRKPISFLTVAQPAVDPLEPTGDMIMRWTLPSCHSSHITKLLKHKMSTRKIEAHIHAELYRVRPDHLELTWLQKQLQDSRRTRP